MVRGKTSHFSTSTHFFGTFYKCIFENRKSIQKLTFS
uniref:Uncharacterized protein MANES_07G142600 n=1 Tax=Rhizophora mucronata TaxID=61149 RepID=A0A2P2LL65_RHIMU